jgi:DnaJ-class molecular chaperone
MVITRKKKRGGHHLFKRLGVSRKATKRQIKKAYEKRKKKGKLSKRVKYAYRILSNSKSRKKYLDSYKKTKKHRRKNQRGCSRKRKR